MSDLPPDEPAPLETGANDEALQILMERLKQEHSDLDAAISAMEREGRGGDRLAIQRLKKRKLQLKDRILMIEDQINPDIIA